MIQFLSIITVIQFSASLWLVGEIKDQRLHLEVVQ